MNTDKTLVDKFAEKKDYPIWYYKELTPVEIDYVIAYLLNESFVVEIDGSKHVITFGYNKESGYIGQNIRYDDINNSNLSSYDVVGKGFTEGKWFIISEKDTSNDFRLNYEKRKKQYEENKIKEMYRHVLTNATEELFKKDKINKECKSKCLEEINNKFTYEELENLIDRLFGKDKEEYK